MQVVSFRANTIWRGLSKVLKAASVHVCAPDSTHMHWRVFVRALKPAYHYASCVIACGKAWSWVCLFAQNVFCITQTVHGLKYRVPRTNCMHTLLCTKMFEVYSYMFRTVIGLIFRESHNLTNHTHPTVWSQDLVTVVCNTPVMFNNWCITNSCNQLCSIIGVLQTAVTNYVQ
jgi:hypothetical protein